MQFVFCGFSCKFRIVELLYEMKTLILDKTLRIFETLVNADNPLTLKDVCARTGITPPAASRLLSDLTEAGYVHKVSYRTFEPGLGMIYLGQSSLRHNFFPQNAILLLRSELGSMGISGALAGMFNGRLVYLYHSHREHSILNSFLPMPEQNLYGSNIALVILCVKYGCEKALSVLLEELERNAMPDSDRERREHSIRKRIAAFEKDNYAVWDDENCHWNICFPLVDGSQVYGLSFLIDADSRQDKARLFLKCSSLATRMRKILTKS